MSASCRKRTSAKPLSPSLKRASQRPLKVIQKKRLEHSIVHSYDAALQFTRGKAHADWRAGQQGATIDQAQFA